MKKQINKYLFVLFALIIISITAIGSASASEDIHGFDLSESDSSSCLNAVSRSLHTVSINS